MTISNERRIGPDEGRIGRPTKNEWIAILGLVALAALLRLPYLRQESLWFDEIWTWKVTNQASLHAMLTTGLSEDIHVPAYFIITYYLTHWFGDSEAVLRMPAAIFGVLSVPAIYALGRRMFRPQIGLMAALFLTFNYSAMYYSIEARPYSMMLFMAIVTTWLWYEVFVVTMLEARNASPWLLVALWISLIVGCYTHYFVGMLIALQMLGFAAAALYYKRGRAIAAWSFVIVIVAFLPWVPELRLQLQNLFSWIPVVPIGIAAKAHIFFTFGNPFVGPHPANLSDMAAWLCFALLLLSLMKGETAFIQVESSKEFKKSLVLLAGWAVPFLIAESISLAYKPIYVDRYLSLCLPFGLLLVCHQVARFRFSPPVKYAFICVLPLLGVVSIVYAAGLYRKTDDWRGVAAKMESVTPKDGRASVLAITERLGVAQYYLAKEAPDLHVDGEASVEPQLQEAVQSALASHPRYLWLFGGQDIQPAQKQALQDAQNVFVRIGTPLTFVGSSNVGAMLFRLNYR